MNKTEAAAALAISLRSLERRMRNGRVHFTKTGDGQYSEVSFTRADLGLPEPEPEHRTADLGPLAVDLTGEQAAGDPVVPLKLSPRLDCAIEELDFWEVTDLKIARLQWLKPDDLNGSPSNAPAVGSSTMPSPQNYARFVRANDLILKAEAANRPRVPSRRVDYGQRSSVTADCAAHNDIVANLGRAL